MNYRTSLVILCLTFCIPSTIFAQSRDTIQFSVLYDFKHVFDTAKPNQVFKNEMILQAGSSTSKYLSAIYTRPMPTSKKVSGGSDGSSSGFSAVGMPLAVVSAGVMSREFIYQLRDEERLLITDIFGINEFMTEQPMPAIDWKLQDAKKVIGGLTCQKATGAYGGRVYDVWFARDVPLPYGPWKLNGLPGIILEAVDRTGTVQFLYKDMSKGDGNERILTSYAKPVKVSLAEFEKAKKDFFKDPAGIVRAQARLPNSSPDVPIVFKDSPDSSFTGTEAGKMNKKHSQQKVNNPLEIKR